MTACNDLQALSKRSERVKLELAILVRNGLILSEPRRIMAENASDQASKKKPRVGRWIIGILLVLIGIYIYWGSKPDPRFTLAKLQGLTPDQVITRLGPPDMDPRLPKWGGWTPQNSGGTPLILYYEGGWEWRG